MDSLKTKEDVIKDTHKRLIYWFMLAFLLTMVAVKGLLGITVPAIVFLLITSFMMLIGDRTEIIATIIVCIPLSVAFQYKYAIIVCIIVYVFKYGGDIKFGKCILPLLVMMCWELLHGLFGEFSLNEYLRDFSELILLTFLMCISFKKIDYSFICRALAFSTLCMGLIVICSIIKNQGSLEAAFMDSTYRLGSSGDEAELFGLNYNANALGTMCNMSILVLLQLKLLGQGKKLDYIMIVGLLIVGVMTLSRAFLIGAVLVFLFFIISSGNKNGKSIKNLFVAAVIMLLVFYVIINFAPFIYERFAERFEVDDITSGRSDLITFYNQHIYSNLRYSMFGLGLQNLWDKIFKIYPSAKFVPHNSLQEMLVVWGIPGLIMFVSMIISMIKTSAKYVIKHTVANYSTLLFFIIISMSGQLITSGRGLLYFSLIYISMCIDFKVVENCEINNIDGNVY